MHNGVDRGTRGICSAVNRNTVRADGGCAVAARDAVDRSLVDGDAVARDHPCAAVGNAIARGQIVRFAAENVPCHRAIRDRDLIVINQSRPRCNTAKEIFDRAGVQRQLVPHGIRTRGGVAAVARNEARRVVEYEGIVLDDFFIAGLTAEVFPDGIAAVDRIPSTECARMRMVRVLVAMELCVNVVARRRGRRIRLCAQLDAVLVVAAPIRRTGRCIVGKSQIRCAIGRCVAIRHQRDRADIAEVVLHTLSLCIDPLAAPTCRVDFDVLPRNRAPECVVVMGEREHGVARCNTRVQMEFVRVEVLRGVCRNALGLHNQVVVPNGIEAAARNARGVAASVEGRIAEVRCGTPVHIAEDNAVARRSAGRILSIAAVDLARDRSICYRNRVVDGRGLAHAARNRNSIRCGPGAGPCSQPTAREFHPAVRHATRRRAHTNDSTFDNAVIHIDRVWICLRSPRDLRDVQTDAAVRISHEVKAVDDELIACHSGGRRTRSARRDIANDDGKVRCPCRADGERVVRHRTVHQFRTDNVTVGICRRPHSIDSRLCSARSDSRTLCRIRRRRSGKRAAEGNRYECGELPLCFHSFEHYSLPFTIRWKESILAALHAAFSHLSIILRTSTNVNRKFTSALCHMLRKSRNRPVRCSKANPSGASGEKRSTRPLRISFVQA